MTPFFGTTDSCLDYVNLEAFPKFEDRAADKWNEVLKSVGEDEGNVYKALGQKDESTLIPPEGVLVDQLKSKPGGQLVEVTGSAGDKSVSLVLCELPSEQWVLVFFSES